MITGGLGHIGSALIRHPSRHEIVVLDNLRSQRYCSLFDAPSLKFVCGDIGQPLRGLGPFDVVVHLAGIINAAEIEKDPNEAYFINTAKTAKLARDCKDWGARMILASTTSVYQGGDGWLTEKSPLEPPTHYAKSKVAAEISVDNVLPRGKCTILRFGTIFGWSPGIRFDTAVQKFCWDAFLGNPIKVWKNSQHKLRPYLGINDCVQAINLAIDVGLTGTYNVVTDHFTPQNVVDLISAPAVEYVDDPILSQESYRVSNDKIRDHGFDPQDLLSVEIDFILEKLGVRC